LSEVLIEDYKLDDVNTATQDATSAPIPCCCRTAAPSLLMLSARFLSDETLCEAEAGLRGCEPSARGECPRTEDRLDGSSR
jgi:hypothetical protein